MTPLPRGTQMTQPVGPWHPPTLRGLGAASLGVTFANGQPIHAVAAHWAPCFRVIAREYAGENVYDRFATNAEGEAFAAVAAATSGAARIALGAFQSIPPDDRLWGPGAGLIMAAFAWPGTASRFSTPGVGTYYAAAAVETAVREILYHDATRLAATRSPPVALEKTVVTATLTAPPTEALVDLRAPEPAPPEVYHPTDYRAGQALAGVVREVRGDGLCYDSVRHPGGTCVAVFSPPLLADARAAATITFAWDGTALALR